MGEGSRVNVDKVTLQDEYEEALQGEIYLNEKIIKLVNLGELAYKDFIFLINTSSLYGMFHLDWFVMQKF